MKAMLSTRVGGPETLELEELPAAQRRSPAAPWSRSRPCGVNYPDVLIIEDKYQFKPPRPFSPGGEIAGVVKAVGEGVDGLQGRRPGAGQHRLGRHARAARRRGLAADPHARRHAVRRGGRLPDDLWHLLLRAEGPRPSEGRRDPAGAGRGRRRRPGGGGAGQGHGRAGDRGGLVAKRRSSSPRRGARPSGVVYPRGPFDRDGQKALADLFKQACGPAGADVIYDGVGGDYAEAALRAIAWEGRFLVIGFPAGIPRLPLNLALLKGCEIVGVFWGAAVARDPAAHQRNVAELLELYAEGKIRPHVSERFPLARGRRGHRPPRQPQGAGQGGGDGGRRLMAGRLEGKVAV